MKKIYIPFFLTLFFSIHAAIAQPTLTGANSNYIAGDVFLNHTVDFESPGNAGANVTWDFSSLVTTDTLSSYVVTAASTPFSSSFPGSSHALMAGGGYVYSSNTTSDYSMTGVYAGGVVISYSNPQKLMTYPFTYNDTFVDSLHATFVSGVTWTRDGIGNVTADGYGTLIMPYGTITNVIRIRSIRDYSDTYSSVSLDYLDTNYSWCTPGVHGPILSFSSFYVNGSLSSTSGSYLDDISVSGVGLKETSLVENSFNLAPNPSYLNTTIRYTLKDEATVKTSISNLYGQVVKEISKEQRNVGSYTERIDLGDLASGIYFINLNIDGAIITKKLIVN